MAARRGLMEDLFEIGMRVPWRVALGAAVVSAIGFHILATIFAFAADDKQS